jgi:hypothetical protein
VRADDAEERQRADAVERGSSPDALRGARWRTFFMEDSFAR